LYSFVVLLLIPVCFLPVTQPSYSDLACILAPALRLRLGFPPSAIYFQYDLFPSLVAVGWHRLGGDPFTFSFCTRFSFLLLLAGCFLAARRLFAEPRLAALLLVALGAVRVYAIIPDANFYPQVTPLRLDLWILPLAAALLFGLEHWTVGLVLGSVCFFARSFGMIYLGSYALALTAEFLARRRAAKQPLSFWRDAASSLHRTAPALILLAAGPVPAWLAVGSPLSGAALHYHRLGLGMMRISPSSFYWLIAPGLAATGWLAFSLRAVLPEKRAQAALFAVALAIGNSIYFFGRSHEQNLLNISASLLFCLFLGLDLAGVTLSAGSRWAHAALRALAWLALLLVAFLYSGRIFQKVGIQVATVTRGEPVPNLQDPGPIRCGEIAAAAPDRRVFVFSPYDYWFYERCGWVPVGYIQPLLLQTMRAGLVLQLNQLLDKGYKIVVPKNVGTEGFDFTEIATDLPGLQETATANYAIYSRRR
jgi:hypothetical protein